MKNESKPALNGIGPGNGLSARQAATARAMARYRRDKRLEKIARAALAELLEKEDKVYVPAHNYEGSAGGIAYTTAEAAEAARERLSADYVDELYIVRGDKE